MTLDQLPIESDPRRFPSAACVMTPPAKAGGFCWYKNP